MWRRPLFMRHSNGSFPLCRPTEPFPLWPFGDTLQQLDVHNMRIPTSNRAWVLTITEMLRPEECAALCFCDYSYWIAAFEQHRISSTRSEGQLLKYTKNSMLWRWLKYVWKCALHFSTIAKQALYNSFFCVFILFFLPICDLLCSFRVFYIYKM